MPAGPSLCSVTGPGRLPGHHRHPKNAATGCKKAVAQEARATTSHGVTQLLPFRIIETDIPVRRPLCVALYDSVDQAQAPLLGMERPPTTVPAWDVRSGDLSLCNPERMPVERYRYRGQRIAHVWNTHEVDPAGAPFRLVTVDDADEHAWLEEVLTTG